ncbi:MAG: hypothetical protein V8S08_11995 [Lachnoclostridium sp.]
MEIKEILRGWKQQVVSCLHEEEQIVGAGVLLIPEMYEDPQKDAIHYIAWLQGRLQQRTGWKMQVYVGVPVERLAISVILIILSD